MADRSVRDLAAEVQKAIDLDAPVGIEELVRWRDAFLDIARGLDVVEAGLEHVLRRISS